MDVLTVVKSEAKMVVGMALRMVDLTAVLKVEWRDTHLAVLLDANEAVLKDEMLGVYLVEKKEKQMVELMVGMKDTLLAELMVVLMVVTLAELMVTL
jgi:hypothetical protein